MENLPVDYFVTSQAFTKTTHRDVYPEIDPASPSNSQAGKVIVITGASKGVGRLGFVHSFAKANPKGLVLVARSAKALEEVAKEVHEINKDIEVLAVPADLTDKNSVSALWEKVKAKFGHADVLVNNAGLMAAGPVSSAPQNEWWADFEVNVHGLFLTTQGFLSLLPPSSPATIINMTSGAAHSVIPTLSSYSLSKLAALQIQAFVAAENPHVTAVALHPGIVQTDMTAPAFARFALDTPALVGGTGVWLASGEKAFLSGRYVSANWAVGELVERKAEIESGGKLTIALKGDFGAEQFA